MSECHAKPLIIHAVRSCYDIIEMRKISGAVMPWIIHGFRGSLRMAEQLLQHDVGISLGIMSLHDDNKASMLLKMIPMDKLFFETDVSTVPIKDVYERASLLLDMDVEFLRDNIYDNFIKCFCR